ncbi:MAG: DUF3179 domain-containing (seleno)protein [Bacteroidia bacterium]
MKALFYFGLLGLLIFEIAAVYFIMPFPGSQRINSLGLAYTLYYYRWVFRIVLVILIAIGFLPAFRKSKVWPSLLILLVSVVTYFINANMFAEAIFHQPKQVLFANQQASKLPADAVVLVVANGNEAKAFPIRYIAYHHQVQARIGGNNLLVTYCDVCRSGYVFEPLVNGKAETFRLVGMDHFNAMLEDQNTKTWWRQATGEAIAGELKGQTLPIFPSQQMSLAQFFNMHPNGTVMLPDPAFEKRYDQTGSFEKGKDTDSLTYTDTASWKEKSWVVGVVAGNKSKVYDWNVLKQKNSINDTIGSTPITLVMLRDQKSFFAFQRNNAEPFEIRNDSLISPSSAFSIAEVMLGKHFVSLQANQTFWHTWRVFHPQSTLYHED